MSDAELRAGPREMTDHRGRHRMLRFGRPSIAALCALAIGMFFLATFRAGHEWGDDFSLYISHAQNIVRGVPYKDTLYIYNPQNAAVGPRLYPPGFPLLLTPAIAAFGLELRPMKIMVLAFFVGSLLIMIPLFRRILPPTDVTLLVLIVGLNPFFWEFKDHILSDVPFLFFVLLSLLFFARGDTVHDSASRRGALGLASGVAAYAACTTRPLGWMLIPCYIGHDLIRNRRVTVNAAVAVVVVVTLAGVQHVVWLRDTSYFDQLSNPLAAAWQNIPAYLRSLADLWENGYSNNGRRIAFLGASVLAGLGYASAWRKGASALDLFPLIYLTPVLMWPSFQGTRFLIPIVPFYFCYCLLGGRWVATVTGGRGIPRNAVLAVFLGVVFVTYAARYSVLQFGPLRNGIATPEGIELFAFVTAATEPQDVLVFSRPRALALMTGRRVSGPVNSADPCRLWQYMKDIGASYLITGPEPDTFNEDAAYLRQFVAQFGGDLRRVMTNRAVAVYRIERNPCPQRNGLGSKEGFLPVFSTMSRRPEVDYPARLSLGPPFALKPHSRHPVRSGGCNRSASDAAEGRLDQQFVIAFR